MTQKSDAYLECDDAAPAAVRPIRDLRRVVNVVRDERVAERIEQCGTQSRVLALNQVEEALRALRRLHGSVHLTGQVRLLVQDQKRRHAEVLPARAPTPLSYE